MHCSKWRVHPDLGIIIELQRKEEQRARTASEIIDRHGCSPLGSLLQGETSQPTSVFDELMIGAMRRIMREPPNPCHRGHGVEDVLDCTPPKAARHGGRVLPNRQ